MNCVDLAKKLISFKTVTPDGLECLEFIKNYLEKLNFKVERLTFNNVENIFATFGNGSPHILFLGHVDVVPEGDGWDFPAYEGVVENEILYGRGAVDMKGSIAAFLSAIEDLDNFSGTISIILTSDEEGLAENGTVKVIEWMNFHEIRPDYAITGEPTSKNIVGDTIKNGRRGSISFEIEILGVGGHVAYPDFARNPFTVLVHILHELNGIYIDDGSENFAPSNLEIVKINSSNQSNNVIPESAKATINIRFNNLHTFNSLEKKIKETSDCVLKKYDKSFKLLIRALPSAEPFLNNNVFFENILKKSVFEITNFEPELSTEGGTSDARFIYKNCSVLELGLLNKTAHKKNESVSLKDLYILSNIYKKIISNLSVKD